MLAELRVRALGVITDAAVTLHAGLTAITGETGAGKTMVVEALTLLRGGRADAAVVRAGEDEAVVEGRFVGGGDAETVLVRSVPASGRSRAWVDGRMATAATLAEAGGGLVDLYGQHEHQSLLDAAGQRRALDGFAGTSTAGVRAAREAVRALDDELTALGGDPRSRARQADMLRAEIGEIDAAALTGPDEDEALQEQEARLAGAQSLRLAAAAALGAVDADDNGGAVERLGAAAAALDPHGPLAALAARARAAQADAADLASELRQVVETWEDDPERLAAVQERRRLLADLRRKYGSTLAEVLDFAAGAAAELGRLDASEARAAELQAARRHAVDRLRAEEAVLGQARRAAAPVLAQRVQARLRALAMPHARMRVTVGDDDPGDDVTFWLGANPGEPEQPLAKVASGGELARAMLALRLVLPDTPPTLVFDEVDAGVGGEAALAVGRALAELARRRQVLVVTHLAQVAAFADRQLVVTKRQSGRRTEAGVAPVAGEARLAELARMLGGRADSAAGRRHAQELLDEAGAPANRQPARTGD